MCRSIVGFAIAAATISCMFRNNSGNVHATKLGDTSHPLEHGSPIAELRSACGSGARTAAGAVVQRQPYLQQVTTSSVMIGWVTTASRREQVVVTTTAGAPVTVGTEIERATRRTSRAKQRWARIDGLAPDAIYCYAIVDDGAGPLTERTGFRTAPAADSTTPIRFLAFGDSGGHDSDQFALRDEMFQFPFDLVIHTGDLANDHGTRRDFEETFFGVYTELLRNVPLFPSAGNHDYKTIDDAYREVFAVFGDGRQSWYSYDWGRLHFAALDTGADYATQARWLDADLAATQRPWKIVYLHRPPYSSGVHGSDVSLRRALAPVLEKHHVQLVLSGHDHDYERIVPQHGVAYVVTGGGGRGTREVGGLGFSAFSTEVIHFVIAEVGIDELVLHAIDATGVEFDSMVVPRLREPRARNLPSARVSCNPCALRKY